MKPIIIAPSLLSADFARLGEEVDAVTKAGADMLHLDVMDNHYVPNLTVGPLVCAALRNYGISLPIDVHLMTDGVDDLIVQFAKAGANQITFHPEASKHVDRSLSLIRDMGCKAGIALNPATHFANIDYVLDKLDLILLMTVNPGFGGQTFIESMLGKIKTLRKRIDESGHAITLAVDGGVKVDNIKKIHEAGAEMFVMGSAIFNEPDYGAIIKAAKSQLI